MPVNLGYDNDNSNNNHNQKSSTDQENNGEIPENPLNPPSYDGYSSLGVVSYSGKILFSKSLILY